jgi:fumarate hydratase class II
MVCAQVVGNDAAITVAGMSGVFELNVMMPVLAYDLLQSIEILAAAARLLAERSIDGIQPRRERAAELVEMSFALVTSLAPKIGYDAAAAIAKEAAATGRTVREVARAKKVLPDDELDRVLDPWAMTEGGIVGGE